MEPPPQPEPLINKEIIGKARTPLQDDHDDKYGVPTLEELGFDVEGLKPPIWIGGETEALGGFEDAMKILKVLRIVITRYSSFGKTFGKKSVGGELWTTKDVPTVSSC